MSSCIFASCSSRNSKWTIAVLLSSCVSFISMCLSANGQNVIPSDVLTTPILVDNSSDSLRTTLLPAPFKAPSDPVPGASATCVSCAAKANQGNDRPRLNSDGDLIFNVKLADSPYVNVGDIFTVAIGKRKTYAPQECFALLPPNAPEGINNAFTVVASGQRFVFASKTGKVEDIENAKSSYLRNEGGKLVFGRYNTMEEIVFSSEDGVIWRLSSIRRKDFAALAVTCEYSATGWLQSVVLPGGLRYAFETGKGGFVSALTSPDGERTQLSWDGQGQLTTLQTLMPTTHPLYPANPVECGIKTGEDAIVNDIHCEYSADGRLASIIGTNGDRYAAEYGSQALANGVKRNRSVETLPDESREFCETILNADGTKDVNHGHVVKDAKGSDSFIISKHTAFRKMNGSLGCASESVDGIEKKFDYAKDEYAVYDALGNKTVYKRNNQELPIETVNADGTSIKHSYDANGRLLADVDELGYATKYEYNAEKHILAVEFPGGLSIRYMYDNSGLPIQVKAKDGTVSRYEWDSQLRLTAIINPDGTRTEWAYKGSLRDPISKSKVANDGSEKYTLAYAYDYQARLTKLLYPDGTFEAWKYGCCGVLESRDRANAITKYTYDNRGEKTSVIDPNELKTLFRHDYRGRLLRTIYPDGSCESTTYNLIGKPENLEQKDGQTILYSYNKIGQKTKSLWQDGTFSEYEYDKAGNLLSISGNHEENIEFTYIGKRLLLKKNFGLPRGATPVTVEYDYDNAGHLTRIMGPGKSFIAFGYDLQTGYLTEKTTSGIVTHYERDQVGRITKISKYPAALSSIKNSQVLETRHYDIFGHLAERRKANGDIIIAYSSYPDGKIKSSLKSVSTQGFIKETTLQGWNFDGTGTATVYRAFIPTTSLTTNLIANRTTSHKDLQNNPELGRVYSVTVKKGGRILSKTDAIGNQFDLKYDDQGTLSAVTLAGEVLLSFKYDRDGHLVSSRDVIGRTFELFYNTKNGKIDSTIFPDGGKSQIDYDAFGRVAKRGGTGEMPMALTYDSFGNMLSCIDANGAATDFEYDSERNITKRIWPDATSVQYEYDINGHCSRKIENGRITNYEYNEFGQIAKLTISQADDTANSASYSLALGYNDEGNLVQTTDSSGTVDFAYDTFGHVILEKGPNGTVESRYNDRGLLSEISVRAESQLHSTKYFYDDFDRLNRIVSSNGEYIYSYDMRGHLISVKGPGYYERMTYDKAGRLTAKIINDKTICSFEYDSKTHHCNRAEINGNIWQYNYDELGQVVDAELLHGSSYAYSYDKAGNPLVCNGHGFIYNKNNQRSSEGFKYDKYGNLIATPDSWHYTWDLLNRLASAENGACRVEFIYDFASRRIGRKVFNNGALVANEKYVYNGFNMLLKYTNTTSECQYFSWNREDLVSMKDVASGKQYSYIKDNNGNVISILGENGLSLSDYNYAPFGQQLSATHQKDHNPFRFSSEQADDVLGLVYYNFRYFSPKFAMWLSRDPIQEKGGSNLYAMANNNTIERKDRLGLSFFVSSTCVYVEKCKAYYCGYTVCPDMASLCCENGSLTGAPQSGYMGVRCCPGKIASDRNAYNSCISDVNDTYNTFYNDWTTVYNLTISQIAANKASCYSGCSSRFKYYGPAAVVACQFTICDVVATAQEKTAQAVYIAELAIAQTAELAGYLQCKTDYPCGDL